MSWPQPSPRSGHWQGPRQLPPGSCFPRPSRPGRVCQASGGALGGQTSLGRGEGAFLLPEPAGRGFPEVRGGLASSPRGEPLALPAWQEGSGQQQQLCMPALLGTPHPPARPPGSPSWPPSAQAPRPPLQDADQTRLVPRLAGPGTTRGPISAACCVHPGLPHRAGLVVAVCVRTRGLGARPPGSGGGRVTRAGLGRDRGQVSSRGVGPVQPALQGGGMRSRSVQAGAPAPGVGSGWARRGRHLASPACPTALGLGLAAPGHVETLLAGPGGASGAAFRREAPGTPAPLGSPRTPRTAHGEALTARGGRSTGTLSGRACVSGSLAPARRGARARGAPFLAGRTHLVALARGVGLDSGRRLYTGLRGACGSLACDLPRLGEAEGLACASRRGRAWPGYGAGPSLGRGQPLALGHQGPSTQQAFMDSGHPRPGSLVGGEPAWCAAVGRAL